MFIYWLLFELFLDVGVGKSEFVIWWVWMNVCIWCFKFFSFVFVLCIMFLFIFIFLVCVICLCSFIGLIFFVACNKFFVAFRARTRVRLSLFVLVVVLMFLVFICSVFISLVEIFFFCNFFMFLCDICKVFLVRRVWMREESSFMSFFIFIFCVLSVWGLFLMGMGVLVNLLMWLIVFKNVCWCIFLSVVICLSFFNCILNVVTDGLICGRCIFDIFFLVFYILCNNILVLIMFVLLCVFVIFFVCVVSVFSLVWRFVLCIVVLNSRSALKIFVTGGNIFVLFLGVLWNVINLCFFLRIFLFVILFLRNLCVCCVVLMMELLNDFVFDFKRLMNRKLLKMVFIRNYWELCCFFK